jgi:hypothetical protein
VAGFTVGANTDFTLESSDGTPIVLEGADPQVTVVAPAPGAPPSQVTLQITAAGPRVITVRDTGNDQRLARRQMTVT